MPCYILRAGDTSFVKIGWADEDVEARRKLLQTAHWEDLTTIRVIDGPPSIERAMHRRFAAQKVRREWYRFHSDMLTFYPQPIEVVRNTNCAAVLDVCSRFGGQAPLSRLLGLSLGAASEWVATGFVPYPRIAEIIDLGRRQSPPIMLEPNDFFVAPAVARAA